jgi:divalent metal cation (Fe/Co/Zn/Cd) transporter
MELIEQFLKPELIARIVAILVIVNVVFSAISMVLEKVKDLTDSQVDNKIYAVISKIAEYGQKLVDMISGNKKHK